MMILDHPIIALVVIAIFVALLFRKLRSNKWNASGLCFQCGGRLDENSRVVTLRYHGISLPEKVNFCGRCTRHRVIWGWLVTALIITFIFLIWFGIKS
jgi:hypothetical protein